jgi:hypothetical protein
MAEQGSTREKKIDTIVRAIGTDIATSLTRAAFLFVHCLVKRNVLKQKNGLTNTKTETIKQCNYLI